ncbi:hypothetical protein [Escherichia coli]|uniref:hypothetical protein n=1 Tax=Escherichia coli TaxID=562 RepID=UPI000BDEBD42|nr:hypothetical protein [Escherichia coli]EFN5017362.1 hypothetical protein [Escherichia coli]WGB45512.1 hypothetical protein NFL37_11530 [Escherichia coli]HAI6025981.1 hypothetical protein [Escherichia coli]HAY5531273.1 hypothetical protein [Escherichia coli]HBA7522081.1 hypothetical protein [Escherichia coli]
MDKTKLDLIEEHYSNFSIQISNLDEFCAVIKKNSEHFLELLYKKKSNFDEVIANPNIDPRVKELNGTNYRNFMVRNPYTNDFLFVAHKATDLAEQIDQCYMLKNKQYQWALVEAYELYEDFIEDIYSCLGYIDSNFWVASDFGDIQFSQIKSMDLQWFKSRVEKKKDKPKSILKHIRSVVDAFSYVEDDNKSGKKYKTINVVTEHLRHVIVHRGGIFGDLDKFKDRVCSKADVNKKSKESVHDFIDSFVGLHKGTKIVLLTEIPASGYPSFMNAQYSRINFLIQTLQEHAFILKQEVISYFQNKETSA